MTQIKKKFILNGAVDGDKLLLLNNQAVKAKDAAGQEQELFKFDADGVLKLLKMPELPSQSPGNGNVVAPKAYVDSEVASEAAARTKADSSLQSQIDTEKGRVDAILSAADADKDSFAEIVSLINSIDTTNDNAFGAYVLSNDAALAQEIKDRQAGDNALDARLDIVEGADTVEGSIAKAEKDAKDYTDAAISTEQAARSKADSDLDARLDVIEGLDTVEGSVAKAEKDAKDYADGIVASEAATREKADNALDGRLDVLEGADTVEGSVAKAEKDAKDYADGIVASEAATRSKADTDLQGQITTEKNRIDAILLSADADKDSFAEIVALINSVDTTNDNAFAAYVLSNDAALAQEIKDRQAGDNALDARLDVIEGADTVEGSVAKAEKDAKDYADSLNTTLTATLNKEVGLLDGRLDILEGADTVEGSVAKAEKDAKDYADSLIATEQDVRDAEITAVEGRLDIIEGDASTSGSMLFHKAAAISSSNGYTDSQVAILDARIDSLEGVAYQKESFTLVSGDVSNGYVELAYQAQPKSTTVFIDRLGATEDVDYTVSVVGGKTRLTWIGQLASGGASELVVGDKVHVKYGK